MSRPEPAPDTSWATTERISDARPPSYSRSQQPTRADIVILITGVAASVFLMAMAIIGVTTVCGWVL